MIRLLFIPEVQGAIVDGLVGITGVQPHITFREEKDPWEDPGHPDTTSKSGTLFYAQPIDFNRCAVQFMEGIPKWFYGV